MNNFRIENLDICPYDNMEKPKVHCGDCRCATVSKVIDGLNECIDIIEQDKKAFESCGRSIIGYLRAMMLIKEYGESLKEPQ